MQELEIWYLFGGLVWNFIRKLPIEELLFSENKFKKKCYSFCLEHKRRIAAKASFDGKGHAVTKWRRADEESRIWKLV